MKLIKEVVEIGNGAAVYVPREYKGKEIVIVLPEGVEDIKRRVLTKLIKFMPNIIGVYLYGSYARGEQTKNSDIDIMIIVKEKDSRINSLFDDIDIRMIPLEGLKKAIENMPAITMPILKEAETFLNPVLIEELRNSKIDYKKFKWHFDDTKRILKIVKGFAELDKEDIASSNVYSLIMRIRVLCMIESLLKNKTFSNKAVKKRLIDYGLSEKEFEKFYLIYQKIRDDEEVDEKINKEEIDKLINILEKYLKGVENEAKKAAGKRN